MRDIIALHGLKRSGKDTLAKLLCKQLGGVKFAFADALYERVAEMFSLTVEELRSDEFRNTPQHQLALWKASDPDYRDFLRGQGIDLRDPQVSTFHLQRYGTDFIQKQLGRDYWARLLLDEIAIGLGNDQPAIISDLRRYGDSWHELESLRRYGVESNRPVHIIRVERDTSSHTGHESDNAFPDNVIDLVVRNDRDPGRMLAQVLDYLSTKATEHAA